MLLDFLRLGWKQISLAYHLQGFASDVPFMALKSSGFKQVVYKSTTKQGTLLDHIYVSNTPQLWQSGVVPTYYSYHDAVLFFLIN